MAPIRICHVNLALGFAGGEQQTLNLLRGLASLGLDQVLVCHKGNELALRARAAGIRVTEVGHFVRGHRRGSRADLVHAHCGRSLHWAAIEHLLRATPYIYTRRVDNRLRLFFATRWRYRHAARVVCLSRAIEAVVQRAVGPVRTTIIASTYSDLRSNREAVAAIRSRWPGKRLVGQVGRLLRHKGHDVTVAAARRLAARRPDLQFLLLGDGPRRVELERSVRDLPNVSLLGHERNIGDYLAALDLFVFPSLTEGLGSSILEAMQAGVPVVASAAGGIPDLIEDGVTGLLVPPGDDAALAAAIAEVTDNPDVGQRLVSAARQRLSEFSPETVSSRYLGLYRQILSAHAGRTGA